MTTHNPGADDAARVAAQRARDAQREIAQMPGAELAEIAEAGARRAQAAPRTEATLRLIHAGQMDARSLDAGTGAEGGFWPEGEGFWEQAARADLRARMAKREMAIRKGVAAVEREIPGAGGGLGTARAAATRVLQATEHPTVADPVLLRFPLDADTESDRQADLDEARADDVEREEEPPVPGWDLGPEIDDQGGMSERRYLTEPVEPEGWLGAAEAGR
jgi:hypothetical protein